MELFRSFVPQVVLLQVIVNLVEQLVLLDALGRALIKFLDDQHQVFQPGTTIPRNEEADTIEALLYQPEKVGTLCFLVRGPMSQTRI